MKKYLVDVIPLARLPYINRPCFSYISDQKLPPGTLVTIPFSFKVLNGIVAKTRNNFKRPGKIQLKKITKLVEKKFLTAEQMKLAEFIANYHFCPLGVVLKFFIPRRVKFKKKLATSDSKIKLKKVVLTNKQEWAINQITSRQLPIANYLLFGPVFSGKTEVCVQAIAKIKNRNPQAQFLILVPEIASVPQTVERYRGIFKNNEIAVIHSRVARSLLFSYWQKIKDGETKLIIGTRMAVFCPFKNLKMIVIDEEQDISFKQWEMDPRYDARKIAEKLAEIHRSKIVRVSAFPSVETYHRAEHGEYLLLKLEPFKIFKHKLPKSNIEIIDMKKERWSKNMSPLSRRLQNEITNALKNNLKVMLFVNQRGLSRFSICVACKAVLRCQRCDRALILAGDGLYRCLSCSWRIGPLAVCAKCGGFFFRHVGFGTQKIEREVAKMFPSSKILRVDRESLVKKKLSEVLFKKLDSGDYDILIGTQVVIKSANYFWLALTAVIDADNLLSGPDFRADERAFQLIAGVMGRVFGPDRQIQTKGIIQTFNPEQKIIKLASKLDYENFYQQEIKERQTFNLPPFSRVIKLTCRARSQEEVAKKTKNIYDELRRVKNIVTSPPHAPLVEKKGKNYYRQLVIKADFEISEAIKRIIGNLSDHWIIDVDPVDAV